MIKNSFKQLVRQPVKCLLFFFLIAAATVLVTAGTALSIESIQRIRAIEETYTTIGTIRQEPVDVEVTTSNSACTGASFDEKEIYASILSAGLLNFPGADYVTPPEKRPYFISYLPQLNHPGNVTVKRHILEFTPLEAGDPELPVEVEVTKVISSNIDNYSANIRGGVTDRSMEVGDHFYFCQCSAGNPKYPLVPGEKYVTTLFLYRLCPIHEIPEYGPYLGAAPTQLDENGELIDHGVFTYDASVYGEVEDRQRMMVHHVDEDFYEPGHMGAVFENWAEYYEMESNLFLTTCTNSLDLMPSWHSNSARVSRGRAITPEEFASGALVCMVPESVASQNLLQVGDKVNLPLLCAYDGAVANGRVPVEASLLDAGGNFYEPFWEHEYEIVGIYSGGGQSGDIADDMFIIPTNSIGASWENNLMHLGPMTEGTASFQIKNGSIQDFDQALRAAVPESTGLAITYDDQGYTEIMNTLHNSRDMALLLLIASILAAVAIIVLLLYFFIVREKKRTAVERSLGMTKRQCRTSLLCGLLIFTLLAAGLGGCCGVAALREWKSAKAGEDQPALEEITENEYLYSTRYSLWERPQTQAADGEGEAQIPGAVYWAVPVAIWVLVLALSMLVVEKSFREDPIYLLGIKGDK